MLNKLFKNLFNSKKGANDELIALVQKQSEVIAQLQAQINTPSINSIPNTTVVSNDLDTVQADNYESTINRNEFHKERTISGEFENMDWKDLQRNHSDSIGAMLDEIQERIMTSLNPNYYGEVLADYRTELLQQYLMRRLIVNGTYQSEYDNLDSLTREVIISQIVDIEVDRWVERQERKGKNPLASQKQIDLLKKNNIDTTNIKYWYQASKELEDIFGSYDNNPTDKQKELIAKLVGELGLQGYDMSVSTKKDASLKIEELNKLHEEKFGVKTPTTAQKELYARYLKLNGKRLTKSVKEKMDSMSARELSEAINELRNTYNSEHPEASEGQVNYICSLCEQLMMSYDRATVTELTKIEATNKIDELTRMLLFRKMKRTMSTVTMDDINKLTKDEVKIKLDEFRPQRNK